MRLFRKKLKQEHKVMQQHARAAGTLLPEYHRPTPSATSPKPPSGTSSPATQKAAN